MNMYMIAFGLSVVATSICADQKGETKIDSISYEADAELRIFHTGGAVRAFALHDSILWSITEDGVTSLNMQAGKKSGAQAGKKSDVQKGKTSDIQIYKDLSGIPSTDATCIAVDNGGVVWIGTKAGLVMRIKDSFKVLTKANGLSDNAINKILPMMASKLWVATDNGVSLYQGGAWTVYGTKDGLAGEKVRDVTEGPNGTVWFGTNKGISCFDGSKWTTHNMKNGLSWNDTKAIAFDDRSGTIWAAVGDKDMNSYDGKSWKVFMEVAEGVVAILADTQSRIWIATASGLMKFNGEEWISDPQKIGITAAQVTQISHDEKGNLWFGMESGVLKLDNPYPY